MRPKGTQQQLEIRRRVAMALLQDSWGVRKVARHVQASPGSVCRWRDTLGHQGETGLNAKRHPGSTPKLSAEPCQSLLALLSQGARAHGYRNALWTLRRIAALMDRHFGLAYCPSGGWRVLRRLKWRPPKPARRARERDEDAMARWRTQTWPQRKKTRVANLT